MSLADADFSGKTGSTTVVTFTPQAGGFAYLAGASLTDVGTGAYTALTVTANQTSFPLPAGDSFIQIVVMDGPRPELGSLSCTVGGGASISLWNNRAVARLPGEFNGFGS